METAFWVHRLLSRSIQCILLQLFFCIFQVITKRINNFRHCAYFVRKFHEFGILASGKKKKEEWTEWCWFLPIWKEPYKFHFSEDSLRGKAFFLDQNGKAKAPPQQGLFLSWLWVLKEFLVLPVFLWILEVMHKIVPWSTMHFISYSAFVSPE